MANESDVDSFFEDWYVWMMIMTSKAATRWNVSLEVDTGY